MPKVSICIPSYNHATYLKQRIDSVINQTFQDFELIILDDYSQDNSKDIIEKYRNHPKVVHIIYNEINSGNTFKQWQKGLELANGEYIWIAESDDLMESSFLGKAVDYLNKNEKVGVFQCGSNWINENGVITASDEEKQQKCQEGKNFIFDEMTIGNSIYNASAVLFRRTFITIPLDKKITELKFCGDWLFWIKILERSDLFYLNENLNSFRNHSNNISGKAKKEGLLYLEGIGIYTYLKSIFPEKFSLFDLKDREWSFRFSKEKFSLKIMFLFFKKSLKASWFIPFYVIWYKIKRTW